MKIVAPKAWAWLRKGRNKLWPYAAADGDTQHTIAIRPDCVCHLERVRIVRDRDYRALMRLVAAAKKHRHPEGGRAVCGICDALTAVTVRKS